MFEAGASTFVWIARVFVIFLLASVVLANNDRLSNRCDELDGLRNDRINCTSKEEPSCYAGWTGELCNDAICREGCHPIHGYCTQPGECKCALGWRGKNCDECVPLPGCKHGYCSTTSYECICEPGWDGNYCSIPLCLEGCHSTRGYCKFPNECRCRIGWGGETCEECKPLPGCVNGYCTKPLECRCREGWTGLHCDVPTCKANCSTEHGYCLKPGECRCKVGWWGENCDTCFPYPGCKHGTCDVPWECNCKEGWKGLYCDQKNATGESFCDKNPGKCLNGGTCLNVPDERNYTCSCPSLFTGKHCDYLAYSRASIFPIFSRGSLESRSTFSTTLAPVSASPSTKMDIPITSEEITASGNQGNRESTNLDEANLDEVESFLTEFLSDPMAMSSSVHSTSPSTESSFHTIFAETIQENEDSKNPVFSQDFEKLDTQVNYDYPYTNSTKVNFTSLGNKPKIESDLLDLDDKRRKYLERKTQIKLSSKPRSAVEKEKDLPTNNFPRRTSGFLSDSLINGPSIKDTQTPIIVVELSEPTKEFETNPTENPIANTDANSPQANQIRGKTRFLRHHASQIGVSSDEVPSTRHRSSYPFRQFRLLSEDRKLGSSNYRINPYLYQREVDRTSRKTKYELHYPGSTTRNLSHLIPQTRINRRTGIPPSATVNAVPNITPVNRNSRRRQNTKSSATPVKDDKEEKPKTYYEENYAGRVHIGDVTEVDRYAPLEEIVDAFIELKKLTS